MYSFFIVIIYILLFPVAILYKKPRAWIQEQYLLFDKLKVSKNKKIWFHCASIGEYQQIKPLVIHYHKLQKKIVITFFSHSGYNNFHDFNIVEQVSYLPIDLSYKMNIFIQKINPELVFIAKNDIWPNMIHSIRSKNVPLYLISFKLKEHKMDNIFIRLFYKTQLPNFNQIFTQDLYSQHKLKKYNIHNSTLLGDLRINQVINDSKSPWENKKLKNIIHNHNMIIYGSIDHGDCNIITDSVNSINDRLHVIIPHNHNDISIYKRLKNKISKNIILYSQHKNEVLTNEDVLIIDQYGLLKKIYSYSNIIYIGGGFDKGIHNTLEAAIYGNYLLFGPKYNNFPEAIDFVNEDIGFCVTNATHLKNKINALILIIQNHNISSKVNIFFKTRYVDLNIIFNQIQ